MRPVGATAIAAALLLSARAPLPAQTRGAELTREQKPVYPESLHKASAQGNVILIGLIDKNGTVQDVKAVFASHEEFVEPTITAVRAWVFRPALQNGKPIDIAANIVFPFRIKDDKGKVSGHDILGPSISELAIFPADASGKKVRPEGFPIRQGGDPKLRAEAAMDVPSKDQDRKITVLAEAISPTGKATPLFEDSMPVPAKSTRLRLAFNAPIRPDWEDGVWMLRFKADKKIAGTGQFWLAKDPDHYDFAAALKKK